MLTKNPQWNFIDWVGQPASDRSIFPSYGKAGESCLTSILYLGTLHQGADLEAALGDPALGTSDRAKASALRTAIRARCWSPEPQLFADNPDLTTFSQHMNALAVLYDVAPSGQARDLLDRITVPGEGTDAPSLGTLTRLDAAAATPKGIASVRYRLSQGRLQPHIALPVALTGAFLCDGRSFHSPGATPICRSRPNDVVRFLADDACRQGRNLGNQVADGLHAANGD